MGRDFTALGCNEPTVERMRRKKNVDYFSYWLLAIFTLYILFTINYLEHSHIREANSH